MSARLATRRLATVAPSHTFTTKINYNTPGIVRLAQTDHAAACKAFWRPVEDYRRLMSKLGLRHTQEQPHAQTGLSRKFETAAERQSRLKAFDVFVAQLTEWEDADALAIAQARRQMSSAFRQPTRVAVSSARDRDDATLDEMGFALERHESKLGADDWATDAEAAARQYRSEMTELLRRATGAAQVYCTPPKMRTTERAAGAGRAGQPPLHGVHNDFGPGFADELAAALGAGGDAAAPEQQAVAVGLCQQLRAAGITADALRRSRTLVVNAWRSLGRAPVRRQPLALVDRRSVAAADCAVIEMPAGLASGRPARLVYAAPSAAHAWFWFPELRADEVLLIKQYDSADPRSMRQLHTAVHHPDTQPDAPARRSVEMRALCVLPQTRAAECG